MQRDRRIVHWAIAWAGLSLSLGIHVADEALNDFLPLYNSVVATLRETYVWLPFPTFTFSIWIGGLTTLVIVLLALTPLVLRGYRWLLVLSLVLGAVMTANAMGHMIASFWQGYFVPGVYSSPLLLAASVALLITAARAR